jgi:hypothetical protein
LSEEPKQSKVEQPEADTKSKDSLPESALDQVAGGGKVVIMKVVDKTSPL